jgi:hypothetical protein
VKRILALLAGGLLAAQASAPARAHHSAAMYDTSHTVSLKGTVKVFNWVNPHVTVEILVDATEQRPAAVWVLEASSPGVMTRSGWNKRSFQPGDKVVVEAAPLRSGEPGGGFKKATLADGKVLTWEFAGATQGK